VHKNYSKERKNREDFVCLFSSKRNTYSLSKKVLLPLGNLNFTLYLLKSQRVLKSCRSLKKILSKHTTTGIVFNIFLNWVVFFYLKQQQKPENKEETKPKDVMKIFLQCDSGAPVFEFVN
jgi:hypothetical protein